MTSSPDLRSLPWKTEWGSQTATHGSCFYLRESAGSIIAGIVFSVILAVPSGIGGIWLLRTESATSSRVFAAVLLLVSALFTTVLWYSARKGRWMIVYDRGHPGVPGEIRSKGKQLPVARIRGLSTRSFGGSISMPHRVVVAELHDGTFEVLGPSGVSTWPGHWGHQIATWMGLPFRPGKP